MKRNLLFIDAESDGLYGPFLSVAIVAVNGDGEELERGYYGIAREKMQVSDPWVREHVVPLLGDYEPCENEQELLEKVWNFWCRYLEGSWLVADVVYPVESRLFEQCVARNAGERMWLAPYPLLDLSSMLYAVGIDPTEERVKLVGDQRDVYSHNALWDVELSVEIWKKYIRSKNGGEGNELFKG